MSFPPGSPDQLGYWVSSGTSGATTQVSAVAALLLSAGAPPQDVPLWIAQSGQLYGPGLTTTTTTTVVAGGDDDDDDPTTVTTTETTAAPLYPLLDAGASTGKALAMGLDASCRDLTVYANPMGALVADGGLRRAVVQVEILDAQLAPVAGAGVVGRWSGDVAGEVSAVTDAQGMVSFVSPTTDPAAGVGVDFDVETVLVVAPACPLGQKAVRPALMAHVDELSFELLANFGAGMSSSGLILILDPDAAALLRDVDLTNYRPTYVARTLGAGMSSSGRIALLDEQRMLDLDLFDDTLLLVTFGTGMSSSGLVFDQGFFNPDRLVGYVPNTVTTYARTGGAGMSSSGLIMDGLTYDLSFYLGGLPSNPGIVFFNYGTGMSSSGLVFDTSLFHEDLFSSDFDDVLDRLADPSNDPVQGRGMSSSGLIFDFNEDNVFDFGFDWPLLQGSPLWGADAGEGTLLGTWTPYHFAVSTGQQAATSTVSPAGAARTPVP